MLDYDEISYAEIEDCIIDAKEGKLSPYWQVYAECRFDSLRQSNGSLQPHAQVLYQELEHILGTTKQLDTNE